MRKKKNLAYVDFCTMIGLHLLHVRRSEGMNQPEFLNAMKMTTVKNPNTISKIETGFARRFNMELLAALVPFLCERGYSLEWFFGGIGEPKLFSRSGGMDAATQTRVANIQRLAAELTRNALGENSAPPAGGPKEGG